MELGYRVLRAIRQIVGHVAEHSRVLSREAGLTVPQLLCLKAIGELPDAEITVARVSHEVHLSPPTVSRIIDRLERSGMVNRERRSKDRRRVCLSLTSAGNDRFHSLPTPLQETFLERLKALEPDQIRVLFESLEKVVQLMDASELDTPVLGSKDAP